MAAPYIVAIVSFIVGLALGITGTLAALRGGVMVLESKVDRLEAEHKDFDKVVDEFRRDINNLGQLIRDNIKKG